MNILNHCPFFHGSVVRFPATYTFFWDQGFSYFSQLSWFLCELGPSMRRVSVHRSLSGVGLRSNGHVGPLVFFEGWETEKHGTFFFGVSTCQVDDDENMLDAKCNNL